MYHLTNPTGNAVAFANGIKYYMVLDFTQGTFKIFNNSKQEIATANNLKG